MKQFWIGLAVILIVLGSDCAAHCASTVFSAKFESADSTAAWTKLGAGTVSLTDGYASALGLRIEQPLSLGAGTTDATMVLPLDKVRGRRLLCSAMIRADDVASPPQIWNGVKFMLVISTPTGKQYPAIDLPAGTFDWAREQFQALIPRDATEVDLVLGIEATTGAATYDDIAITSYPAPVAFATPPAPPGQAIDSRHAGIPRLRGAMVSTDVTPADLDVLGGQWGANLIRYQMSDMSQHPSWVRPDGSIDLAIYDRWLRGRLDHLDSILPACRRNGIRVVVDLHTPPGASTWNSEWPLFHDKRLQQRFLAIWDKIAHRYRNNPAIWGYDIANEPPDNLTPPGVMNWQHLAAKTAKLIRSIDPKHAIIVESCNGDPRQLKYLSPIPVPGVVYSIHMYAPTEFTFQGLDAPAPPVEYPGVIGGVLWNRAKVEDYLREVVEFQQRYRVPIYVGEFSAIRWAPDGSAERYLSDLISVFEVHDWDWSYHAFREWQGWSVEYGGDRNATAPNTVPTARELLLRGWYAKNVKAQGGKVAQRSSRLSRAVLGSFRVPARTSLRPRCLW